MLNASSHSLYPGTAHRQGRLHVNQSGDAGNRENRPIPHRPDVQRRMSDLYTTGVPLPFDCVIAREIEDREAADCLHRYLPGGRES